VTRPEREQLSEAGDVDARDRFEGEHPERTWHHGRAVEALLTGYAPSKYPTKQWPPEALLEVWCSLLREARTCFEIDALTLDRHRGEQRHDAEPRAAGIAEPTPGRGRRALNANEPPGVDGEDVRDLDGCALVIGFPGRDARPRERGSFVRGQASRERGRMDIGPLGAYRTPRRPDERLGLGRTSRRRSDGGNHTLSRRKRRGPHRPLWNVCSYGSQSRRRRARIVVRTTIPLVSSFIHPS